MVGIMFRKLVLLVVVFHYSYAYNIELDWSYVLNNPDYARQEREAYFGYTVGLITSASSSWALVGAPRANDTQVAGSDVMERGAVYLCSLSASSSPCRQLIVTNAANGSVGGGGNEMYSTLQDYGWLGGSLDLRPGNRDSVIVTCSPRWRNQMYSHVDFFVNGACYLTSIDDITSSWASTKPWNIVTPLVNSNFQSIADDNGVIVYYYQLGQAGLSAHVREDNGRVWLGAPGMQQWTGSVAEVRQMSGGGGDWTYTDSDTFKPSAQSVWSDYFGYSVESGRFFGTETHMVAGSPRHDLVGKISLFTTTNDFRIQVRWEATGPQIGAYFGAVVATGDVNGDGWSELFVGAPLFSVKGTATESGLVVIYSRKANLDNLEEVGRLIGSGQAGARFGSALMVVGDLDRDGYKDLAVGSPYEADGAGAVYIYRGSSSGLLSTVSQKIAAKDVNSNLKGFGISLSRGADVDYNGYGDFAVGAHEGVGSAVVLRTRPVLKLKLDVSSEYEVLVETGMTFEVTTCVSYNGFNVLEETDVSLKGQVDDGIVPRAVFTASGTAETTYKATVKRAREHCSNFPIKIQDQIENYEQPLEVSFTAEVTYNDPGCEKCGVTSPGSNLRSRVSLPLALGCGPDGVCTPELELSVKWRGSSQLALRSKSTVTLSIIVSVAGKEQSYVGIVKVLLPEGLTAHQPLPYSCSQSGRQVSCNLPNPMAVGEEEELEISVMESGDDVLEEGEVALNVICSASGAQDVKKDIALFLIEDVELELSGHAENDIIEYSPPPTPPAATKLAYQIINRGDTRVNEVRLDIDIPTAYEELTFAQITQQPTSSSSTSECSLDDSPSGTTPGSAMRDPPYKPSARLVCGEHNLLSCKRVICRVREIHLSPIITVEVAYNVTRFTDKLGNDAIIAIYTNAAATYGSPTPSVYKESGTWTTLTPKGWLPPTKSTPAWAYVVAVLVALLILAAVVLLLVKIGFFKRKRPGQNPDGAKEDLEGQGDGEGEVAPLQDTDLEEGEATIAEVEADIHTDTE